ncbi:hypothetical protein MSAN_02136800 [Mycena sanguinolenta]|uniref:Protein kinase domain-containing protein n=1 Tax=Mycena sanguinolenta TaxID=230812 RepID=A0A8H7CME7_9AGAR|nr:hypothetical protein MSAN_02136800 [Mycena sanguinolenta]
MDDQANPHAEYTHPSISDPECASRASGMFSHSQQFTVTGGTFSNTSNHNYTATPGLPSDFRMIPMGDIDLRRVIRRVTVTLYQGNEAEEEWRQDIAKHMSLRHPNIVQICGAASSNGVHATLFYDDLIPVQEVLDHYRSSHFSMVYIYACCNRDFSEVHNYIASEFHQDVEFHFKFPIHEKFPFKQSETLKFIFQFHFPCINKFFHFWFLR